jgi:hypothetical protein
LQAYNKAIDERIAWESRSALKPLRHVESVTEAGERNRAAWAALGGLASLGSAALSIGASSLASIEDDSLNLGDMSDTGACSTPLGDAAPFEYVKSATGDDVLSVAARGVSEAIETQCMAEYERTLDMCNAVAYPMGLSRGLRLCRENAFNRPAMQVSLMASKKLPTYSPR